MIHVWESSSSNTSKFAEGNGFIAVNDFEKYNLPEPIVYHGNLTYSIAVFHQLHCLVFNLFPVSYSQTFSQVYLVHCHGYVQQPS